MFEKGKIKDFHPIKIFYRYGQFVAFNASEERVYDEDGTVIKENVDNNGFIIEKDGVTYHTSQTNGKRSNYDARVTAPLLPSFDKVDYLEEAEQYYNENFEK